MRWRSRIVLATCVLAACATAPSSERQRRISDCLASCESHEEPPRTGPFDQNGGKPMRQPSTCERQCESMK